MLFYGATTAHDCIPICNDPHALTASDPTNRAAIWCPDHKVFWWTNCNQPGCPPGVPSPKLTAPPRRWTNAARCAHRKGVHAVGVARRTHPADVPPAHRDRRAGQRQTRLLCRRHEPNVNGGLAFTLDTDTASPAPLLGSHIDIQRSQTILARPCPPPDGMLHVQYGSCLLVVCCREGSSRKPVGGGTKGQVNLHHHLRTWELCAAPRYRSKSGHCVLLCRAW